MTSHQPTAGCSPAATTTLQDALHAIAEICGDLELDELAARALDLTTRLDAGRIHLAVLGQFKRGKSTLLNALLGEPVLPSSIVPLTAIPTFLKPAPRRAAEIAFADDRPPEKTEARDADELRGHLEQFVTEEHNPHNVLNVERVTVYHPAAALASGAVLIDTPGIGSTYRHNTEATLNFLPQCDAALFVVSADPPITEAEAGFLREVASRVPRLFFVLNKADYLDGPEREQAIAFLQDVLERETGARPEVLPLSARQGLAARTVGSAEDWERSGCAALERALERFVRDELSSVLHAAILDKARRLGAEAASQVALKRSLALMPLQEIRSRARLFRESVQTAARQREMAHDLLAGDKNRLLAQLEEETRAVQDLALSALTEAVAHREPNERLVDVLEREVPGVFEHELGRIAMLMGAAMESALGEHAARADELVARIRNAASDAFGVDLLAPSASEVFEMRREPYWVQHPWQVALHVPPASPLERVLPSRLAESRRRARERIAIERVVASNVENLRWAVLQNVNDAFLAFSVRLDRMLAEAVASIERALSEAEERGAKRGEKIEAQAQAYEDAERMLAAVAARLEKTRG